jgi:hypothetical protein
MTHEKMLPECIQMFKRLDEKLDGLIDRADRINGRYEKHMDESVLFRKMVDRHDHFIELAHEEKLNTAKASQWRVGIIVGVAMGIITVAAGILVG